ncbi:hypothetical protein BJX64DRAFT_149837 [Aspergillus heterothallicus]
MNVARASIWASNDILKLTVFNSNLRGSVSPSETVMAHYFPSRLYFPSSSACSTKTSPTCIVRETRLGYLDGHPVSKGDYICHRRPAPVFVRCSGRGSADFPPVLASVPRVVPKDVEVIDDNFAPVGLNVRSAVFRSDVIANSTDLYWCLAVCSIPFIQEFCRSCYFQPRAPRA